MLVYKISEYKGGPFMYRISDDGLLDEVYSYMDSMEEGNTIHIEVVNITREEYDKNYRTEYF